MNAIDLKKNLESNTCHIHKQQPAMTILENGNLKIKTCCMLFKTQLHLLVDQQDETLVHDFAEMG